MKKKNLLMSAVLVGAIAFSVSDVAFAAEVDGNGGTSKATVKFEANDKPTNPIVSPVKPVDPTDPTTDTDQPTGNTEPLRIDLVPNFYFGTWKVGTGIQTAQNNRVNSNLQVTDGRGTLEGWVVSVSRTEFKNDTNNLAATFTLTPGKVKNSRSQDTTLAGNPNAPVVVDSVAKPIFVANANEGGGSYYQTFDGEDATLNFNSDNAKVGIYESTVTWTLTSTVNGGAI